MKIDGKAIASKILDKLTQQVTQLKQNRQITPHLAVLQIGDDPATTSYVAQKERMTKQIGGEITIYKFPLDVSEKELLQKLAVLNKDKKTHGIILQLPIPKNLDQEKLLLTITPNKDVDGFHPDTKFEVPIASAALKILKEIYKLGIKNFELSKKKENHHSSLRLRSGQAFIIHHSSFLAWLKTKYIVVIGKGKTGGDPIIASLKKMGITPTVIDSKTKNPANITKSADIIVTAVGRGKILSKDMLKENVILLGIGMRKGEDNKFIGDYDQTEIENFPCFYTPIPGGMGPVNAACLMENVVLAAENLV